MSATEAQRRANRRNALRSTGPRSARGKVVARFNARKHGLSAAIAIGVEDGHAGAVAKALVEESGLDGAAAAAIAQALLTHRRVMTACDAVYRAGEPPEVLRDLRPMERYQRRAVSRLRKACESG